MNKQDWQLREQVDKFMMAMPDYPVSAAQLEYSAYLMPEETEEFLAQAKEQPVSEADVELAKKIEEAEDAKTLVNLMRKQMSFVNRYNLRAKLMEHQTEVLPIVKEKVMRNGHDTFIENALYVFLHADENCAQWIYDNYNEMRNEYMKSMLCLVLGFRGEKEMIPFLMDEGRRFAQDFSDDSHCQGPVFAVQELTARFLAE